MMMKRMKGGKIMSRSVGGCISNGTRISLSSSAAMGSWSHTCRRRSCPSPCLGSMGNPSDHRNRKIHHDECYYNYNYKNYHSTTTTTRMTTTTTTTTDLNDSFHKRLNEAVQDAKNKKKKKNLHHHHHPGVVFPWRHSPELLPRLDPSSSSSVDDEDDNDEYHRLGQLWGGGIAGTTHPQWDERMVSWLFLQVSFFPHLLPFVYDEWKDELAKDMSWAFTQGMAAMLSNIYQVPRDSLFKGGNDDGGHLTFDYSNSSTSSSNNNATGVISGDTSQGQQGDDQSPQNPHSSSSMMMIHESLQELYQSARESGKEQLQVRLDCRPSMTVPPKIVGLFVFPFLTRAALNENENKNKNSNDNRNKYRSTTMPPGRLREDYQHILRVMKTDSPENAFPLWYKLLEDTFRQQRGSSATASSSSPLTIGSTVICQVLIECDEIFWVKDLSTGMILQGHEDETEFRTVRHLVRFEMVVDAFIPFDDDDNPNDSGGHINRRSNRKNLLPRFPDMQQGCWQITDIDDHLDGNLFI